MDTLMQEIVYWHWWVLGLLLLILEVFAPGVVFVWLGLAAGVVGLLLYLQPEMMWEWQMIWFVILGLGLTALGRWWLGRHPIKTDQPSHNRRGEQYVGRVFTLDEPVVNGVGKIRVDDTTWKVRGEDCERGSKVRVTAADGVVLLVETVQP